MRKLTEKERDIIVCTLREYNIKRASLFGSFANGDADESSDIDLLIEFEGKKSLLDMVRLKNELQEILGKKVDLVTFNSLHHLLRDRILREQEVFF